MRVLALDYGTKRIGVAVSDELGMIANPKGFIAVTTLEQIVSEIKKLVDQYKAGLIIIGLPLNMDGSAGTTANAVREFANLIEQRIGIPVKLVDERLTTAAAEKILIQGGVTRKTRKLKRDALSAALLLQSFLDSGLQK